MGCEPPRASQDAGLILGLPISTIGLPDLLAEMNRSIVAGETGRYICITNTESMYHGLRDERHGSYIRNADYSVCDGVGVIAAGMFWGHRLHRINGPILQLACSEYGASRGWRHFFYGGKPGVAEKMAARLKEKYPDLAVCGIYEPPFRDLTEDELADVRAYIKSCAADVVWVGLGLLKQERWVADNIEQLGVPWMVAVGAAFDYHSGEVPWAPKFLRALGMEWIFRLILQPKLRARRYWWSGVYVLQAAAGGVADWFGGRRRNRVQADPGKNGKLELIVADGNEGAGV
jgi:N-acetylglucosaminyldiphosphoundecaprenol N-acetyl-beta-D-mannosaminyltransferase